MRHYFKKCALIFLTILIAISITACGTSTSNEIAGTYDGPEGIFIFAKDGSMRLLSGNTVIIGTYTAEKDTLELMLSSIAAKYKYSINGNTMMLYEDGSSTGSVYTKTDKAQSSVKIRKSKVSKLNGTYVSEGWLADESYTFFENGEYTYNGWSESSGTYEITEGSLLLYNAGTVSKYIFEYSDDSLTLFDESSIISDVLLTGTVYTSAGKEAEIKDNIHAQVQLDSAGNEKNVAGTYEGIDGTYIFAKDGTMRIIEGSTIIIGSYSADDESIEMILSGVATKYDYSLNKDSLVLYESGSSAGTVYTKTADGQKTVGLKNYNSKALNGIYEADGWFSNSMYAFSSNGTYKYSSSYEAKHGTYTVNGNNLSLSSENGSEKYTFEVDNGLVIFTDSAILSTGTLYSDVTAEYNSLESNYNSAMSSFNAGMYDDAANKFASISGYFDSDEMVNESYYQKGYQQYEAEKYEEALAVFTSLGSYKDSKELKEECQRVIDLKNIAKISFRLISKSSEAYLNGSRPSNKPTMEFKYGMDVTNGGNEDITALALNISLKDKRGTLLSAFSVSGNVSVSAGKTESITVTNTLKDFSAVTMNDVTAHLMGLDDFTIDIELDSVSLNGRKVSELNDERHIQTAAQNAVANDISGTYSNESGEEISFSNSGVITYTPNPQYYTDPVTYTGTYSTNGNQLSINFGIDLNDKEWSLAHYDLSFLIRANEYRLVNNRLFIRDPSYSDIGGTIWERE